MMLKDCNIKATHLYKSVFFQFFVKIKEVTLYY